MKQIYSSNLETSFLFVFNLYDFDDDGFITKEDIRIILSYVPLFEDGVFLRDHEKEGKFTSGNGASVKYEDRRETQEAIFNLLNSSFANQQKIDYKEFKRIN